MNPHQPVTEERRISCAAPGCDYAMHRHPLPDGSNPTGYLLGLFQQHHARQHEPGAAPDITVEWEISATCSVCEDGGEIYVVDSEGIQCSECNTTWSMRGTHGTREEEEAPDDPDAVGGLLYEQPPIDCQACDFATTAVRAAMDHARDTGHVLTGDGRLEGTTLTISLDTDDDDWAEEGDQ